jgi:prepilin-type N-terminal cleavage/methylation domain-containing protein
MKGFTLLELVISFGILAVLAVIAALIVQTGGRTYGGISADINLQYESQTAMSQIMEYVIDCNGTVGIIKDPMFTYDELYVYNKNADQSYSSCKIAVSTPSNELYLSQGSVAPPDTDFSQAQPQLMSRYLEGFTADFGADGKSVVMTISYKLGSKTYSAEQTVNFRNEVSHFSVS